MLPYTKIVTGTVSETRGGGRDPINLRFQEFHFGLDFPHGSSPWNESNTVFTHMYERLWFQNSHLSTATEEIFMDLEQDLCHLSMECLQGFLLFHYPGMSKHHTGQLFIFSKDFEAGFVPQSQQEEGMPWPWGGADLIPGIAMNTHRNLGNKEGFFPPPGHITMPPKTDPN